MEMQELEHVEHKQSLGEWKEIVETVAAFATTRGGVLYVGIAPGGTHTGIRLGQGTLEDLANKIKGNTDPPQYPSIMVEDVEERAILKITVEESPIKPVWAFGCPYKRVGRTNQRLTSEETQRLMEMTTGRTWDALPCEEMKLQDIHRPAVENFLRLADLPVATDTENVLRNLKLETQMGLRNATALLFTDHPRQFFLSAWVQCALFQGTTSVDFLDEKVIEEDIITAIESVLIFVKRNTRKAIIITGKPQRDEIPEYPEEAVREAVTNALCHRDYTRPEAVQVRIYDNRMEIWNPATLPPDISIDALYREHPSRPRNPLIANALYRARLIEHWGTGTLRIIKDCEAQGLPMPEFLYEMGQFKTIFRKRVLAPVRPLPNGLSKRQEKVLTYLRKHGRITRLQYQELVGVKDRQSRKDLARLIEQGMLVRQGQGSATYYSLASTDHEANAVQD